jgi:hypothetical protein
MDDEKDGAPEDETPWEVSEYEFEAPLWLEALFSPFFWGVGPPLILILGYVGWRLVGG